jgi:hypothetical protein
MNNIEIVKRSQRRKRPLSLSPLTFDEAVTDILKIPPMPKAPKKKRATKKRAKSSEKVIG